MIKSDDGAEGASSEDQAPEAEVDEPAEVIEAPVAEAAVAEAPKEAPAAEAPVAEEAEVEAPATEDTEVAEGDKK